jgi:hypothetical protein
MSTIDDKTLAELHTLAHRVAPEIARSQLYVINQPPDLPHPGDAIAWVIFGQSAALQNHLKSTGAWRGPGWAIIFSQADELTSEQLRVTLLHELSHVLPFTAPAPELELTPQALEAGKREWRNWCASNYVAADKPRWFNGHHHKDFTRVCLHLWWRAALAGEVLPFEGLCGGWLYDLSPCYTYWQALGSEAIRMQSATFAEILATEPPKLFSDVWLSDLEFWMTSNPDAVAKVRAA